MRRLFRCLLLSLFSLPLHAAAILVFGDSLSAGYGLAGGQGYVALLQQALAPRHRVINASVSGETSDGGLTRLPAALAQFHPDIVVLELGANDGLRGLPPARMRDNLAAMIDAVRRAGARPVLVGVALPPNYGVRYTAKFHAVYDALAKQYRLPYVPYLMVGFAAERRHFQPDGLHPAAEAQPAMRDTVLKAIRPLLR